MTREQGFAGGLREWRQRRGWSQLDLAGRADISQRHLSFLELARAAPSRDMVLRLASELDIPLRQQNALLLAAGFAPVSQETDLVAPNSPACVGGRSYPVSRNPSRLVAVDRQFRSSVHDGAVRATSFVARSRAKNQSRRCLVWPERRVLPAQLAGWWCRISSAASRLMPPPTVSRDRRPAGAISAYEVRGLS
jgi:transcriptional regulator with XRE-family HTH domain